MLVRGMRMNAFRTPRNSSAGRQSRSPGPLRVLADSGDGLGHFTLFWMMQARSLIAALFAGQDVGDGGEHHGGPCTAFGAGGGAVCWLAWIELFDPVGCLMDEIVFDEVTYREPRKMRRPDGDARWACLACGTPGPRDLPVFVDRDAADSMERHALSDTSVELGGVMLGFEGIDDRTGQAFVWVTRSLEARHYENTQASFTYTHDAWEEISREREAKYPDLDIVGWYHTHPDFGIFLSGHDQFLHQHFFGQPLQVAYVVDPVRMTRGFFQSRDGGLVQLEGFHVVAPRANRSALARTVNDLESVPQSEAGGAGLSPRLEAELVAMLSGTRTQGHRMHQGDAPRLATLAGVLGILGGIAIVMIVFWASSLTQQLRSLEEGQEGLRISKDAGRMAIDTLNDHLGEAAAEKLVAQYGKVSRERDEARSRLEGQLVANQAMAEDLKATRASHEKATAQLAKASETAGRFEADSKEAKTLREKFKEVSGQADRQSRTIADQELALDALDGKGAVSLVRLYSTAWYSALAGWITSGVLVACLFTLLARRDPRPTVSGESPMNLP
jgi:proteasome lid subunit RPN8/RPN11